MAKKTKTLLLGLDGMDWQLINPLIEKGALTSFKKLKEIGCYGNITTLNPTLSPMLWNSIATGKRAGRHGIHGFTEVDEENNIVRPVSSISRKCKAIWNIMMQNDYKCHVVNWFASHPAEPLNGSCISDFYPEGAVPLDKPWPLKKGTIYPERLEEHLEELRMSGDEIAGEIVQMFVPKANEVDQEKDKHLHVIVRELAKAYSIHNAATWLINNEDWDFLAVYWRTPDLLFHYFMPYHPPAIEGVDEKEAELYQHVVYNVCGYYDLMLTAYLQMIPEDTRVIVLSDHGFQSGHLRPSFDKNPFANPEAWHRPQGIFMASGPGIRKNEEIFGARLLDVTPTILKLNDLEPALDMDGRVLSEIFEEIPDIKPIQSWETVEGDCGKHPEGTKMEAADAEQLIQQFVDLGYIDPLDNDKDKAADQTRKANQLNLARDYLDAGYAGLALPILETFHYDNPDNPEFIHMLAQCQRSLGLTEEASAAMAQVVDRLEEGPRLTFLKANLALDQRDYDEGLRLLKEVEKADKKFRGLHLALGRTYNGLGKFDDAEKAFNKVLETDAEDAMAHQGLAYVYLRKRFYDLAASMALQAIGFQHNSPLAHFYVGLALERLEYHTESLQAFENAVIYAPRFVGAHRALIRLYSKAEKTELAEKHRKAIRDIIEIGKNSEQRLEQIREASDKRAEERAKHPPANPKKTEGDKETKEGDDKKPAEEKKPVKPGSSGKIFTIVSGLPRSGTSLMMQILNAGGIPPLQDDKRLADENNPEGYFEWQDIKKLRQDPKLIEQAEGKVIKIISMLLPGLPREHSYKVIYMDRPVEEVSKSQGKMLERMHPKRPKSDPAEMAKILDRHKLETQQLLEKAVNVDVLKINYPDLISNSSEEIHKVKEFLKETLSNQVDDMIKCVKPELYREKADEEKKDTE